MGKKKKTKSSLDMKSRLKYLDKKFHESDAFLGKSSLTFANGINSSRTNMVSGQYEQYEVLTEPEVPGVLTGYEDLVGEFSTGYFKTDAELEVVDRINKFELDDDELNPTRNLSYLLVVRDKKTNKYEVIKKQQYEKLTETYGYRYNTENIDSKEIGETIEQGEVLYKSTSYDDYMNFRYGINAKCVYLIDTDTTEDAIVISNSLRKRLESMKVDAVKVPLNDNDILINIYGKNEEYKSFPDIGEKVKKDRLTVQRRINYSQLLYDLKIDNLNRVNPLTDTSYYANGVVVDIDIYSNKQLEELDSEAEYNGQILKYFKNEQRYHKEIVEKLGAYRNLGQTGPELNYLYKRSKDILDPDVWWRDSNNSPFNHMQIVFTVVKEKVAETGAKLAGRYGNKGVVSEIRDDDKMPFILETGERIDAIFNELGKYNRLNPKQGDEVEINFIKNRVMEMVKAEPDYDAKLSMILEIVHDLNAQQGESLKRTLSTLDRDEIIEFIEDAQNGNMRIRQEPFWNNFTLSDFEYIYDKWDIHKYTVCVKKFGRTVKLMNALVVGEQYIMKLKHTAEGKFSARSTAHVNPKDLPDKSSATKNNKSLYPKTPVKMGEMEKQNILLSNDVELLKEMDMTMSSSIQARRATSSLYEMDILDYDSIKIDPDDRNRNVEILNVRLSAMGLELEYYDEDTGEVLDID